MLWSIWKCIELCLSSASKSFWWKCYYQIWCLKIACKVYSSTLSVGNIQSAFKRCGIFPFDATIVSDSLIAPSLSFAPADIAEKSSPPVVDCASNVADGNNQFVVESSSSDAAVKFLEKRGGELLKNVCAAKVRKTLSKVVSGKPITEDDVFDKVKEHVQKQTKPAKQKSNSLGKKPVKKPKPKP